LDRDALLAGPPGQRRVDRAIARLKEGTMPPAGQPALAPADRASFISWATCGADPGVEPPPGGFDVSRPPFPDPGVRPADTETVEWRATDGGIGQVDDSYRCWSFGGTEVDRFIRRIEPVLDDARVLHHMVLYQVGQGPTDGREVRCGNPVSQIVYAWAPGQQALSFPGGGLRTGPDRRYVLEIHYNNAGRVQGVRDESGVRVFHGPPEGTEIGLLTLGPEGFILPASQETRVSSQCNVDTPFTVVASMPHMHGIGWKLESRVRHADGTEEDLITLSDWDFNVQLYYEIGMELEAGDQIVTHCTYRNDRGQAVRYGAFTEDEMCYNFMYVVPPPANGHCDGPVGPPPGDGYTPGACAGPGAAAADPPLVTGSFHGGRPSPATGGQPADGLRRLVDAETWLVDLNVGVATIDAERSHLDVRGTFWLSGNETALDLRGTTFIETLEGPSLQRATDVSIAGPLVAVDPGTGEATVNATCGRDGQVPYHYSVDEAGRLVIDVPLEGIEGVLRLFFE
ncbi:MAG: hypothetical protein KC549_09825, partial [Myxococcales bacterium]|nr:hypothetical protein [Myxococcales bacterium]